METKYITIPFDEGRAKRITSGVEPGKIVTRDGRDARIVCWDYQSMSNDYPILALIREDKNESPTPYSIDGRYNIYSYKEENSYDLLLSVPEWTTFKDGDVVTVGWESGDHYCKWISIIKVIDVFDGDICTRDYVALCLEADDSNSFSIEFDCESDAAKWIRTSTEEEIHELIEDLKKSKDPKAKEYLKRFFGIEEMKEFDFKPFDKVLVRDDDGVWFAGIFSHLRRDGEFFCAGGNLWEQCLPYNDKTKHLLGTSDAWEG